MADRLQSLIDLLDDPSTETVGTSVRLPVALRKAAVIAAELGFASSTSEMTAAGLRSALEALVQRAVLDEHYERYPQARPDLAEIAQAMAEIDGNPLASQPALIRRAAQEILAVDPAPRAEDVLMFAAGLAAGAA